jgi:electron transfer flavoprotein beta subunit
MNILVILRAVKDPAGLTVNRKAQKVFVNREEYIFNPSDRNALEAALRLAGQVTLAACGGAPAEQVLRDARAMGAERAFLLKDRALERADAGVLTLALSRLLDRIGGADLVLCGAECLDADLAQVGPRLAQALHRPFIGEAHRLSLGEGVLRAIAAHGRGFRQLEADLPAVAAVAVHSNKPRYAPGKHLINVYTDALAVESLTAADLELSEAELMPAVTARGEAFPPEREPGTRLEGDVVGQLVDLIRHA